MVEQAGEPNPATDQVVQVLPTGVEFAVNPGEAVFAAADRAGLTWPTTCGGLGDCGNCIAAIESGVEHCSPVEPLERETLQRVRPGRLADDPRFRLVCQLRITGPITLTKRGVRPR